MISEEEKAVRARALQEAGRKRTAILEELRKVTEEEVKPEILAALDAGISFRRAAQLGGVGVDTVARWRREQQDKEA